MKHWLGAYLLNTGRTLAFWPTATAVGVRLHWLYCKHLPVTASPAELLFLAKRGKGCMKQFRNIKSSKYINQAEALIVKLVLSFMFILKGLDHGHLQIIQSHLEQWDEACIFSCFSVGVLSSLVPETWFSSPSSQWFVSYATDKLLQAVVFNSHEWLPGK